MFDPLFVAQLLLNGLVVGAAYGLAAIGLTLIFGVLEKVNFAHGELYMLASYCLFAAVSFLGLSYPLAVLLVLPIMSLVGYGLSQAAILPNMERPFEVTVLSTLAVAMILQSIVRLSAGSTPVNVDTVFETMTFEIAGILFFGQRVLILIVAVLAIAGFAVILRYSRIGLEMRAAAQNRLACQMVGIDLKRVANWSVVCGAVLTGIAGVTMAPLFDLSPDMGVEIVFKSFAVVIIGGMGSAFGAVIAGVILGVVEAFTTGYGSVAMSEALFFIMMILVLLVRPHGLFGRTVRI
ncbi:MAG: branched-chain amino acid ABC transporter permease [bacterium]